MRYNLLCILFLFTLEFVSAQSSFDSLMRVENPIASKGDSSDAYKEQLLNSYAGKATQAKDKVRIFLAHLYRYQYLQGNRAYEDANAELMKAKVIADAENNNWNAWVLHQKGGLSVHLREFDSAIGYYESSIIESKKHKDSLLLAINYEQLTSMYGQKKMFDSAHYYFTLAEPLLNQYGTLSNRAVAFANFGNLLQYEGKTEQSIAYYLMSIAICDSLNDGYRKIQTLTNLASAYEKQGQAELALKIFHDAIDTCKVRGWPERLIYLYNQTSIAYKGIGDYKLAMDYFVRFHKIRDSIITESTKKEIAELEVVHQLTEQQTVMVKKQAQLDNSKSRSLIFGMLSLGLLAGFFIYYIFKKSQTNHLLQIQKRDQEALESIVRILHQKNEQILQLNEDLNKNAPNSFFVSESDDRDIYSMRILTDADWLEFKSWIERTNPGLIKRVTQKYLDITESELRVLLLLRLNISSKEMSVILGIAPDSIKKTRYRLRKRLNLQTDDNLEDLIASL